MQSIYINMSNVILNKTVTKLFTILTKYFFPYLNPTRYLKLGSYQYVATLAMTGAIKGSSTLQEKCPYSKYLSVFSPNAGKHGPE